MEELNELPISQIIQGLGDPDYSAYRITLLQVLANKMVEESLDINDINVVMEFCIKSITEYMNSALPVEEVIYYLLLALSNITFNQNGLNKMAEIILSESHPKYQKLMAIVNKFLNRDLSLETSKNNSNEEDSSYWILHDPFHPFASVLCNLSSLKEVRTILTKRSLEIIPRLYTQINSRSVERRRGVVGTLKNCLFDQEEHWWMVDELKLLTYLLPTLITPTPFTEKEKIGMSPILYIMAENESQKPESDINIVTMLLECILLLCQTRIIRHILRSSKVYPICRNIDLYLMNDHIHEVISEIVNFLERDETPNENDAICNS